MYIQICTHEYIYIYSTLINVVVFECGALVISLGVSASKYTNACIIVRETCFGAKNDSSCEATVRAGSCQKMCSGRHTPTPFPCSLLGSTGPETHKVAHGLYVWTETHVWHVSAKVCLDAQRQIHLHIAVHTDYIYIDIYSIYTYRHRHRYMCIYIDAFIYFVYM